MGLEITVPGAAALPLASIAAGLAGIPALLVMVDNVFLQPGAAPPGTWRDARLRTAAGTLGLARRGDALAVTVFGNADEDLLRMQADVARALAALAPAP